MKLIDNFIDNQELKEDVLELTYRIDAIDLSLRDIQTDQKKFHDFREHMKTYFDVIITNYLDDMGNMTCDIIRKSEYKKLLNYRRKYECLKKKSLKKK